MGSSKPKQVLVSGASGLLGSALFPALQAAGHSALTLQRSEAAPAPGQATWNLQDRRVTFDPACAPDAVVHLAGETVGQRWTSTAKCRMWESRCDGTRILCEALLRLPRPPATLACASAIGYYGDRGEEWLDETARPGDGFLADLAQAWENATGSARAAGMRVIFLRFGIVLSTAGGALARMLPAFRMGVAGRLGDGQQYWSWITRADAIRAIMHVLEHDTLAGPINLVSPNPVTNQQFTKTLGAILHRPTLFAMPRLVVQTVFGQMGREMLLAGARVKPARLLASGFTFEQPDLGPALERLLARNSLSPQRGEGRGEG